MKAGVPDLPGTGTNSANQAEEAYEPSEAIVTDGAGVDQSGMVDRFDARSVD